MIRPPFDDPAIAARLRTAFEIQRSLLLPGACEPAALRMPRMRRFFVADRGCYEVAELKPRPELRAFAEAVTGLHLKPAWTRLFRLRHRGYALVYDDALTRIERGVELTLDLSRHITGAPVVWSTGLQIPQLPGLLALVERTRATYRYDRYLPASVGRGAVVRLRAAFETMD